MTTKKYIEEHITNLEKSMKEYSLKINVSRDIKVFPSENGISYDRLNVTYVKNGAPYEFADMVDSGSTEHVYIKAMDRIVKKIEQ